MALTVTNRGTGADKTAGTSYGVLPASNFAAGSLAVLVLAYDNAGTNGTDPYSSISDSLGNTWTSRASRLNDPGAANAGCVVRVFTSGQDVGTILTSTTVTVDFGAVSVTAKAYAFTQVAPAAGSVANYDVGPAQGSGSSGATDAFSTTTNTITNTNVVIGAGAAEDDVVDGTGDTDTTNGSWGTLQSSATTGGGSASNMGVYSQAKVVTATATQQFNFTLPAAADWAAQYIQVKEEVATNAPAGNAAGTGSAYNATAQGDPTKFVREVGNYTTGTSATTHVIAISVAPTTGNHLVLVAIMAGGRTLSSVTDTQGNTWQVDETLLNTTNHGIGIASCKVVNALTTADTISMTWDAANVAAAVVNEYTGFHATTWADKSVSAARAADTVVDSGATATTAEADEQLVGGVAHAGGSGSPSSNPVFTPETLDPLWEARGRQAASGFIRVIRSFDRLVSATGAYKMAGTLDGSWVNTAAIVTYLLAATGTQAPAGNAAGTGTAYGVTTKIAPAGGLASGIGTTTDAAASVKPSAGNAAGAGAAADITAKVAPTAEAATGTGTAQTPSVAIAPTVGNAAGTGTASDATVIFAREAPAEAATGTGAASGATASVAPTAEAATGTGTVGAATASIAPTAEAASGTGAASGATAKIAPVAGSASGTGVASDVAASVAPTASVASGTGAASDATVTVGTNVAAENAAGTGAASGATIAIAPSAGQSTGAGTASGATVQVAPLAGQASGTGAAQGPVVSVAPVVGQAAGTGAAYDATVLTGTLAPAELASGTGAASGATVSLSPSAGVATGTGTAAGVTAAISPAGGQATGTGTAQAPSVGISPAAGQAPATGAAYDATVTTGAVTNAPAGLASGSGTASDATTTVAPVSGAASGSGAAYDATVTGQIVVAPLAGRRRILIPIRPEPPPIFHRVGGEHAQGAGRAFDARIEFEENDDWVVLGEFALVKGYR